MAIEILDYRHSTEWKLAEFTEDESFTANIEPEWPLVLSTFSCLDPYNLNSVWQDFFAGKRRGKPTELRNISMDGMTAFAGCRLGVAREVFNVQAACAGSMYAFHIASLL